MDAGFPPAGPARQTVLTYLTTPGSLFSASMLRDIESRGRTEVDQILGDLLQRRKSSSTSPILAMAHLHVKAYEARRKRELSS
jgi:2-dehydropantoate 2-reductase